MLESARRIYGDFTQGLDERSAARVIGPIHALLDADGVVIADLDRPLAATGVLASDAKAQELATRVVTEGCPAHEGGAVAAPIAAGDDVAGALVVAGDDLTATQVKIMADWLGDALDHGRLESAREELARAELRALRAQISPHFLHNSLSAIISLVRSDPERARDLLFRFAGFIRYSFSHQGDFTTVAEEFRAIQAYLELERARFGPRLRPSARVAPEVLPVAIPVLVLQPLVENAIRHGIEKRGGTGSVTVTGAAVGADCVITVEDDGVGMDPQQARAALTGRTGSSGLGLANTDRRLRMIYGPEYGLVVETAPGAGTKVIVRVPRSSPGVTHR